MSLRSAAALAPGRGGIFCGLGVPAAIAEKPAAPASAPALAVTYLANEGFLVEGGGARVLIDGLFGGGIGGYPALGAPLRRALERGEEAWSGIDVALASHHHGDHFDPAAVARFLRANPRAVFVSTPQAVARLETAGGEGFGGRVRAVLPEPGEVEELEVGGVTIRALNLHHGPRQPPVENLGFVVDLDGARFLHLGDTEAEREDFRPHLDVLREVDVALLPFWFLASEWRIGWVRDELRPRCIVAAHLPEPGAPASYFGRWESRTNLLRVIRDAFPEVRIPEPVGPQPLDCP